MEIHFDPPDDENELQELMNTAWALAVTQFGHEPPYEEVRKIFIRLIFEQSNGTDDD
ncbi:hypothetical protein [Neopusillimonas maritima]|uniref:hypothetical protein n=1 Tax=Neopusillimonas maritima TaxID=2026239 RepID=UPI0013154719|nr:hypothetical protein [Neopusillimonas maritima]